LHTQLAKDLYKTADFIRRDSLWDAQIAQIYVNTDREIELIPRVGSQRILIGNADSLNVKLRNLQAFYKQVLPHVGWDKYRTINIKYTNQVIGVKNELTKADSAKMKALKLDSLKMKKDTSQIKM
jgi:cell division protein FtsQ